MTGRRPAVRVEDVGVRFRPYVSRKPGLPRRKLPHRSRVEVVALDGVSFEVMKGEAFGVIGPNGAGKSTLLKVMAGTLEPDSGKVTRYGRLSPLLTLGAGFNAALSGRQNILLGGLANGLSKKEIEAKFTQIIEFSDLGDAIDRPMGTYSSGMFARLAFSVAVNLQPEILLLDEVMAVGDAVFRRKSMSAMRSLVERSGTIIVVSHQLKTISDLCQRALWIDSGTVKMVGAASTVVQAYREDQAAREDSKRLEADKRERAKRGRPRRDQQSDRGNVLIVAAEPTAAGAVYGTAMAGLSGEGSAYYPLLLPKRRNQLDSLLSYAPYERLLVAAESGNYTSLGIDTTKFHKSILVHRDPRDVLVEQLMREAERLPDSALSAGLTERLSGAGPSMVELMELAGLDPDITDFLAAMDQMTSLADTGRFEEIRIEDLFGTDLFALAGLLDVDLSGTAPAWSPPSGTWRHWFTAGDVDHFAPKLGGHISRLGYDEDWAVGSEPALVVPLNAPDLPGGDYTADHTADTLEHARHGSAAAMTELAHSLVASGGDVDMAEGRAWAYRAAIQGTGEAMFVLSNCFMTGAGGPPDRDRALFWLKEAARAEHGPAIEALKAHNAATKRPAPPTPAWRPPVPMEDEDEFDDDDLPNRS